MSTTAEMAYETGSVPCWHDAYAEPEWPCPYCRESDQDRPAYTELTNETKGR
jgi:hypothetical protein